MKKYLSFFSLLFLLVLILSLYPAAAREEAVGDGVLPGQESLQNSDGISLEEDKMILPDYPTAVRQNQPFSGENHWYSLVFRGNGEAAMTMRVVLSNANEDRLPLKKVWLKMPEMIIPSDISVFQIILPERCIRYEPMPVYRGPYQPDIFYESQRCVEYSKPDYFNYDGGGKYQKAKYEYAVDTLAIYLPTSIQPEKSGSYFVYFRALGMTGKNLRGAIKYTFESLKTKNSINSLNVGISTDPGLYLKGARGEANYSYDMAAELMKSEARGAALSDAMIDRIIPLVGQGGIVHTASHLAPLESYKVTGTYADSRLKLWGKEIISASGVILLVLTITIIGVKVWRRRAR
ncbi:hypothetical protein A2774_02045 [Candidatus Roizmanbacteria bacterium RIFCSPHIGHO2_01_FULL_39_12c]|uniref:Uncharacterized protein n=1 Tax=Candidatus Roizmanbacteria bacterium RIFCSPHIGHO2_01_FULL_39_12c TaxID=1802031 RepID=A0A1F7GFN5_9BACT|nr:MAG: hypothetical protein A2774_02045 [Candidatus Roizmanbacteria bacterium RIFCSPHIGHO2_01_FULL_39_12c]OGK47230.1 MAG: hypothetical protein A2963_04150 [Candidatus Roizmanbacteria bacterium RIFCSPLOWO2_01_FULL_40_13]